MSAPTFVLTADGTAQLALASAYTAGSGTVTLASAPGFTASPSAPVALTLIQRSTYATGAAEVSTAYWVTGVSGAVCAIGGVLFGTDRNYAIGDYAESRPTQAVINGAMNVLLPLLSASRASVPFVNASGGISWLAPGSTGQVLTSQGAAADPAFAAGSGGSTLTPTAVKTSAYNAAVGDLVPVDCSSASVTVTLPTAPADKSQVAVKLINVAGSNTGTVAASGSDVFEKAGGSTTYSLLVASQAVVLQYSHATAIWYVVSTDTPSGGAGSGTVNSATAGQLAYYAANGTAVSGTSAALVDANGNFNLPPIADPGTVAAGAEWTSSVSGGRVVARAPAVISRGGGLIYQCGACSPVTNTTAWSSLLGTPASSLGSLTIPANTLKALNTLRIQFALKWSSDSGGPSINFRILLGATAALTGSGSAVLAGSSVNQAGWTTGPIVLTFPTVGSGGTCTGHGQVLMISNSFANGNTYLTPGAAAGGGTVAIATNAPLLLDVQAQFGTASVSDVMTLMYAYMELIG